jgi:hypothetical protein
MNTLQILGMLMMIVSVPLVVASIAYLIHSHLVSKPFEVESSEVDTTSNIASKELYNAFLAAFDNHTTLVCYHYFNSPTAWRTWDYGTWERFIYIVNQYLKVENVYWRDTDNLPLNYPEQVEPMWAEFVQQYSFQQFFKNKGLN